MKPRKIEDILKEDLKDYASEVDIKKLWSDIEQEVEAVDMKPDSDFNPLIILGLTLFFCAILFSLWRQNENQFFDGNQVVTKTAHQIETERILKTESAVNKMPTISDDDEKVNLEKRETLVTSHILNREEKGTKEVNNLNIAYQERDIEYSTQINSFSENVKRNDTAIAVTDEDINSNNFRGETKGSTEIIREETSPFIFNEIQPLEANFVDSTMLKIENLLKADLLAKQNENEDYRRKPDFQFSIGAYGGASLALRDLSDKTGDAIEYLQMRDDTETTLETLQTGLKAAVEHKSGVTLQTGLQIMQLTERFEFSGSRIRRDTIEDGLFGYLINPNGDTIPVYDQIINTEEASFEKRVFNRYRFLDIPVSVAYFLGDGDWSVGVQAGVVVNLALRTKGEMLNESEEIKDLSASDTDFFKSSVGLSYRGALSGRYLINDNLQVEATVHGRYFPNSFTTDIYSLSQKYTVFGVNVGVNYLF